MRLNLEMFSKKKQSVLSKREEVSSVVNRYVQSETTGPTVRESNRDQYFETDVKKQLICAGWAVFKFTHHDAAHAKESV